MRIEPSDLISHVSDLQAQRPAHWVGLFVESYRKLPWSLNS
jgi:hypothetical protein